MTSGYASVAQRAGHRCEYCRAPEAVFNFPFEVEHVVPLSRGGSDGEGNVALACRSCNLHKSAHVTGVDLASGAEVELFDPRSHAWAAHFRVLAAEGLIEGLTPVGRATVERLKMNLSPQSTARRHWVRLDLFP
jgi:hypothetical protein